MYKSSLFAAALAILLLPASKFDCAYADPPPWAPAYGHRDRQYGEDDRGDRESREREDRDAYRRQTLPPYGIDRGTCNREQLGSILGGIAGAVLGSTVGGGDGRTAATVGGAILGVIVGGNIGDMMDRTDQACVGQILEHDPDGRRVAWSDNGTQYYVTPERPFRNGSGHFCRRYVTSAMSDSGQYRTTNTACREADGKWRRIN